jgi:hypothetical protein
MCSNEFGSLTNNLTYEMSKFFLPILRDKNTLSILKEVSNKIKFSTFCKYINASEKNTPAALYKIFTNNISSQIVDYFNDYKTLWYGIF